MSDDANHNTLPMPAPVQSSESLGGSLGDPRLNLLSRVFEWAKSQHPAYLTLWTLLIAIASGGYFSVNYVVKTAVPQHLESIKAGYKELWDKHLVDKQATEAAHREHFDSVVRELQTTNRMMDSLVREFILREQRRAAAADNVGAPANGNRPGGG
jgi:hypothetical protein